MGTHKPFDFLLQNSNLELCSICGSREKLTFEHMPPKASGNNRPVNLVGLENITSAGGYLYGKFKKIPQGMGGYKLCENCNNLTGSWYAESYIDFSSHINKVISDNIDYNDVKIEFNIKPLNFLKQVVCILLCADQATGTLRSVINKTNFILNKEEKKIPKELNIYQYYTLNPNHRFQGYVPMWDSKNGHSAEINFSYRPFAFRATFNPQEITPAPFNLIEFAKYDYDQEVKITDVIYPSILTNGLGFK